MLFNDVSVTWATLRTGETLMGGLKTIGREDQSPEGWRTQ